MFSPIRWNLQGVLLAALAAGSLACADKSVSPDSSSAAAEAALVTTETIGRPVDLGTCDSLRAPAGNHFLAKLYARGYQIYRWDGAGWVFVEPSARLYPGPFGIIQVGTHYAGPTWESISGSKVVGAVSKRCPSSTGSIPWLLLSAVSNEGRGIFGKVTLIQRLNTTGGQAPSQAGSTLGQMANVSYTAEYAFYSGK